MKIPANQIVRDKRIGKDQGVDVHEMETKGGLCLIVKHGKQTEILGVGPHRAIARFIAQRQHPSLNISSLEKSEDLPMELLKTFVAEYEEVTEQFRQA